MLITYIQFGQWNLIIFLESQSFTDCIESNYPKELVYLWTDKPQKWLF